MQSRPRIGLVGAGAVARALVPALARAGHEVVLWARRPEAAIAAAGPMARVAASLPDLVEADVLLLAVSESAVGETAARVAAAAGEGARGVALHLSGALGLDVLAPLARAGWGVGRLHPLVSFPPGGAGSERLAGAWFGILGRGEVRAVARGIVESLGACELTLAPAAETEEGVLRYHGAAALAAGGLVALVDLALEGLGDLAPRAEARAALGGLLRGVLDELERTDTVAALTGPAARGEDEVVARHLEALPPAPAAAYHLLAVRMVELARARGLSEELVERLLRRLR